MAVATQPLEEIQDAAFRNETCEIMEQKGILRDYILPLLRTPPVEGAKERSEESSYKKTELIDSTKETIVLESNGRLAQCQIIFYSWNTRRCGEGMKWLRGRGPQVSTGTPHQSEIYVQ